MGQDLQEHGIRTSGTILWNGTTPRLCEAAILNREGLLARGGALVVNTAPHTGRSPDDKYIVNEPSCRDAVWWDEVNRPLSPERFHAIHGRMLGHLADRDLFVQDCLAGASPRHRLPVRIITEKAWHSLLARSLFVRPGESERENFRPEFTLLCAPSFRADPERDGLRSGVFIIINFAERLILIGGTGYGGEIKKSVFTVMNYLLPLERGVLPMHCSANMGADGDVALFFGLSGTGKTTLSADPKRRLIGDDEHGWDDKGIFNFEGGCYAKVINLSEVMEPEIFHCARRFGTIMENVVMDADTRMVDLNDDSITENTRASYPIHFIPGSVPEGAGNHPRNLFMLTCDAFGVLPPISRLTPEQAIYHFLSGYTAKVAGTEDGMGAEPRAVFSACFGAPFLPLPPSVYAGLLREKIAGHEVRCWLVNTGWIGGPFGVGARMRIDHTRALINAALDGLFDNIPFITEPFFGLSLPTACPDVPERIFSPRRLWSSGERYDEAALGLAGKLRENFRRFETLLSHKERK